MKVPKIPRRHPEFVLLGLVFLSIAWRGGKALDAVWALGFVAALLVVSALFLHTEKPKDPHRSSHPTVVWIPLLGFVILSILSFVFSTTRNYGFDEILQTVSLALIFAWAASVSRHYPSRFIRTVSVALLFVCAIGMATYVLQPVSRFVGSFFDYRFHTDYWPNAWAEFVLLAWPMLLASLFFFHTSALRVRDDILRAAILGLVLGCFLLSFSRGAAIAFVAQILLLSFLLILRYRVRFPWKRIAIVLPVTLVSAAVIFVGFNHLRSQLYFVESVVEKATFTASEGSSSVSERTQFFSQAAFLSLRRPLLGFGPYSFRFVQPHVQTEILATSDHAHNVFLKVAMERGIATAVLFLFFLLAVFFYGVRGYFSAEKHSLEESSTLVFLVGVAGVVAHNLIDYNLQFVGIALPLWIALALLSRRHVSSSLSNMLYRRFRLPVCGFVLLLFLLYEGSNLYISSRARHAEVLGDSSSALSLYEDAKPSLFPRDALLSEGAMLLNAGKFSEAENAASTYLLSNAEDARAWRFLGDVYLAWRKNDDAIRAYEKAYDYGRANDAGILRGLLYVLRSSPDKLRERRHAFDSLLNDYGLAILQNKHFIALGSNVEEAVSAAELLSRAFPEDAALYRDLVLRIEENAKKERATYASRPRGFLW